MLPMRSVLPLVGILALGAPLAGCGGDDDNNTTAAATTAATATTEPAATPTNAVTIDMSEFKFAPKDSVVKAGKVTVTAPNKGTNVHELVVIRTDTAPGDLPKKDGKVDETDAIGEIPDVEPGATKKVTLDFKPGKYAIVCALPGHYESGMYGSITAK